MSSNFKPGLGHVGSYQVSGIPFVFDTTNATKTATLNYVTSEIQINTTGAGCTVHFGDADSKTYKLPTGLSTFRVKCKKVVVSAPSAVTASACISLTNIESHFLPQHDQDDWGTVA
tara:strand:- start:123 stop:470 length:348 start_codon:yes stop_codon:yes gene_type:complete